MPPTRDWPLPDERVDVWVWQPTDERGPVLFYDADEVWLERSMSPTSDRLIVCRVIDGETPRREFVEILLTGKTPEVVPSREDRFGTYDPVSPDGRFVVKTSSFWVPMRTLVHEVESGKDRRLRDEPALWTGWVWWSPTGHQFLYQTFQWPLFKLRWKGTILDEEEEVRWVVHLVDLGE